MTLLWAVIFIGFGFVFGAIVGSMWTIHRLNDEEPIPTINPDPDYPEWIERQFKHTGEVIDLEPRDKS